MKCTKKLASLLLALVMALSLVTTAFAAGETGSITVNNAQANETYKVYKMLDLSVNADKTAYTYTVNTSWEKFFKAPGDGAAYVTIDAQGYVTWKDGKDDATSMEAFGKAAAAYATTNKCPAAGTITPTEDSTITFNNLESGYYLITSTNGTLAMVDTTPANPDATVTEKNPDATVDKQVKENSTGNWGKTNDANIGDTVEFRTIISAKKGAKGYVLHDQMSNGLTLNKNSVTVVGVDASKYDVATENLEDGCTFEIRFHQDYLDTITSDTELEVTYSAVLNDKAVIADKGNPNETWLDYGDNSHTEKSTTRTYTWQMDVEKYTKKDGKEVKLAGAEFVLYKMVDGKTFYVQTDANHKVTGWTENVADATTFVTPQNGQFSITGLDAGTYYLKEIKAPAGYNMLKDPIEVVITAKIDDATNVGTATVTYNKTSTGTVKVENKTGAELPSTGGIGTTIFYVVGGLLVVAAGVLLVTRKRMTKSEN